jgi:hypothetical protein
MIVPPQIMGIKFRAVIIARSFSQQPGMSGYYRQRQCSIIRGITLTKNILSVNTRFGVLKEKIARAYHNSRISY